MSEYGLKIKNIEAGTLYEYNLGVRENYLYTPAMLTNSLFLDFLLENDLDVWKEESTRDVICIEFNFGSLSYEEQNKKLDKMIKESLDNEERLNRLLEIKNKCYTNQDKYEKLMIQKIRDEYYINGVDVEYITRTNRGTIKTREVIHYKMLYRSPGKAKNGSCIFICDRLYEKAIDFLRMGIQLPYSNAPIVEISAYQSLTASAIVDRIKIDPKNILILKDVDSFFETNVVSIETDEYKRCIAKEINNYKVKNTLFDGQALIDSSIFPDWADGYILLRHHFCKMASFKSNIQLFFKDYFKDKYDTAIVADMFGNDHLAKDIKLITTDNAMKWLKFDVSYEYWCERVYKNNCNFGIVKTAHKSKLGLYQRMSYQMINSLDLDIMDSVVKESKEYIEKLRENNECFLDYLDKNKSFANDYEVLIALVKHNKEFIRSEYFRERKSSIIQSYIANFRRGKVIQVADNLTIVGSPYAMLLHSVGEDVNKDDTFELEDGCIQCYTKDFEENEYLAEFRSPFNSRNNLGYLHNIRHEKLNRYFDFGKLCIAVNMINTDFQDRNNGADQDSDSIYVTNQKEIVEHAKYCYENYPTIVNNVPKETNHYDNALLNYSIIDNNLAAANRAIGESSNLAQLAQTYCYNFPDQKYQNYVCILATLAQIAIDNAKRSYDIDLTNEIKRIKEDLDINRNGYPLFWSIIKRDFKKNKINYSLECPMNYLVDLKFNRFRSSETTLPMSYFFVQHELKESRHYSKKVEELIKKYSLNAFRTKIDDGDYLLLREDFDELIEDIKKIYISKNYLGLMSWLINRCFLITSNAKGKKEIIDVTTRRNKTILIRILYEVNKDCFLKCFKKGK